MGLGELLSGNLCFGGRLSRWFWSSPSPTPPICHSQRNAWLSCPMLSETPLQGPRNNGPALEVYTGNFLLTLLTAWASPPLWRLCQPSYAAFFLWLTSSSLSFLLLLESCTTIPIQSTFHCLLPLARNHPPSKTELRKHWLPGRCDPSSFNSKRLEGWGDAAWMGWAWRSKGGSILSHNWKVMLDAKFLEGSGKVNSLKVKWRKEGDSRSTWGW